MNYHVCFPANDRKEKNESNLTAQSETQNKITKNPHSFNRVDSLAIFEHLKFESILSENIEPEWVRTHSTLHLNNLCRVMKFSKTHGAPPNSAGQAMMIEILLQVLKE